MSTYLVGGLEHVSFFHILGMSSSQLTFIFFRGVGQPPTSDGLDVYACSSSRVISCDPMSWLCWIHG